VVSDILLGSDPFKGSGSVDVVLGSLSYTYTLAAGTVEPGIDLAQSFTLRDLGLTPTLTTEGGTPESLTFGTPSIIPDASTLDANHDGSVNFALGLTPNTTLENDTGLAGQVVLGLTLLKASGSVTALGVNVASGTVGPLFHPTTTIHLGTTPPIYKNTFAVAFQPQTVNFHVT
jgi:hypothetical protein